jgi:hypothetical protein
MKDKDLIDSGEWVPCRICEDTFGRKRETRRYCATCLNASCEGEHGNFSYIYIYTMLLGFVDKWKVRGEVIGDCEAAL